MNKALFVGEEEGAASRVTRSLRLRWPDLEVAVADTASRARRLLADNPPDAIFVSEALSDTAALALVGEIRAASDTVIIVVGSGRDEADIVEALEAGADDYLSTPISESLVVARVCAALRRARKVTPEEGVSVTCGDVVIDPQTHEVHLKGKPLYLTPTEFKLLYHFARYQGRVVTQQALESVVWGHSDNLYVDVLRKHVQRLRRKLESRRGVHITIATIPRIGYKLTNKYPVPTRR